MNPDDLTDKVYLGDGVYVGVGQGGYYVWLYTDNGISITNEIALEPTVLYAFDQWRKKFHAEPDKD